MNIVPSILCAGLIAVMSVGAMDDRAGEIERVCTELAKRATNCTLLLTRPKWPQDYPIRARLGTLWDINTTGRFSLEILSGDESVLSNARVGYVPVEERNPLWKDPTFAIPWTCFRDGAIHVTWRLVELDKTARTPLSRSDVHKLIIPIELVASEGQVLTAVESWPSETRPVETSVSVTLVRGSGPSAAIVVIEDTLPYEMALGFEMRVLQNGRLVGSAAGWCDNRIRRRGQILVPVQGLRGDFEATNLVAVITGQAEQALRDFERQSFWSGGITVPVAVRVVRDGPGG